MGAERPERVYARARSSYLGALMRLRRANTAWIELQVPVEPGEVSAPLPGWTREQFEATVEVAAAWQDLVRRRKEYTSARRAWREGGWR